MGNNSRTSMEGRRKAEWYLPIEFGNFLPTSITVENLGGVGSHDGENNGNGDVLLQTANEQIAKLGLSDGTCHCVTGCCCC